MSQHPSLLIALAEDRRRILADLADTRDLPRPSLIARRRTRRERRPAPTRETPPAVPATRAGAC